MRSALDRVQERGTTPPSRRMISFCFQVFQFGAWSVDKSRERGTVFTLFKICLIE